jgi:hypothetical protein
MLLEVDSTKFVKRFLVQTFACTARSFYPRDFSNPPA